MSAAIKPQTAMTAERFASGLTYEDYKARMEKNRDRFEKFERENALSDDEVAPFRALPYRLPTVVLTEDWCSDAVATLPLVADLARRSGKLDLRFFYRDQNLDLMDAHLNRGKFRSIPTLIFYDQNWNELGAWLEKPVLILELRDRLRRELYASDPGFGSPEAPSADLPDAVRERLWAGITRMRDDTTPLCNAEVLRELRGMLLGRDS